MAYLDVSFLTWSMGLLQVAGLVSAWLARFSEGSPRQTYCQWFFMACLGLVGFSIMLSMAFGTRYWLASGTTLSVMILAAIWDFSHAHGRVHGNHAMRV